MPLSRHRDGRSKQSRHARALRRQNKVLGRSLRRVATGGRQAYSTLLAVLAQAGGELTITQGTLDQVSTNYDHLGFRVVKGATEHEFIVRLVQGESPEETRGTDDAAVEACDSPVSSPSSESFPVETVSPSPSSTGADRVA